MRWLLSMQRRRPTLAFFMTALGALVAMLLTMLWSVTSHAAGAPPAGPPQTARAWVAARCAACHGLNGNNVDPSVPKLAGQHEAFLTLQLRTYRSGGRPHPVMSAIAKPLSDREIRLAARHYAKQPPMRRDGPADPVLLERGEAVFRIGKPGVPACQYCHGAAGHGVAPVFARLAGQHPEFIVSSLQTYRHEASFGNPYAYVMKAVVQEWSDDDIRAVAAYVGSLR